MVVARGRGMSLPHFSAARGGPRREAHSHAGSAPRALAPSVTRRAFASASQVEVLSPMSGARACDSAQELRRAPVAFDNR